ncbi:MAG: putative metal-binding protein [Usitatibacteraceae bacterium]
MLADPAVSRLKFEREVGEVLAQRDFFMKRGAWIVSADFPEVFVILGTPNTQPSYIPYAALFDFTDYDAHPLSVRLVNPFTKQRLKASEMRYSLLRTAPGLPAGLPGGTQSIVQHFRDDAPFLCLPGVRDYHECVAHTGDSWWLHRTTGEGKFFHLLDLLCKYGTEPIVGIQIQMGLGQFLTGGAPQ